MEHAQLRGTPLLTRLASLQVEGSHANGRGPAEDDDGNDGGDSDDVRLLYVCANFEWCQNQVSSYMCCCATAELV
jgi:hypothetical protein